MAGPPTLAVQIVNYRTRDYLGPCLATVVADLQASGLDHEINLLENCSGEQIEDFRQRFRGCHVFAAPRNLGFGGGHNLLAAQTAAHHLLILNPDVEFLEPATVERLLGALGGPGAACAAGPKLVTAAGRPQPYDHGRLRGVRAQIALRGGHSYWRATGRRQDVAWVSGAALLIERAAFADVGGFDENLFMYKEEEDLCLRLRQRGGRVAYDPSVVVRHHGSVVANRPEALARSTHYYIAKHFGQRRSQRLFAAVHRRLAYLRL